MAVDGIFIWFGLGPAGILFALAAMPFAIYGLCARTSRRGMIAAWIALSLALLAAFVSAQLWITLLSGEYRYGQPVDYRDGSIVLFIGVAVVEGIALVLAVLCAARQRVPRKA